MTKRTYMQPLTKWMEADPQQLLEGSDPDQITIPVDDGEANDGWADAKPHRGVWDPEDLWEEK